jgi:hypothetical protein
MVWAPPAPRQCAPGECAHSTCIPGQALSEHTNLSSESLPTLGWCQDHWDAAEAAGRHLLALLARWLAGCTIGLLKGAQGKSNSHWNSLLKACMLGPTVSKRILHSIECSTCLPIIRQEMQGFKTVLSPPHVVMFPRNGGPLVSRLVRSSRQDPIIQANIATGYQ